MSAPSQALSRPGPADRTYFQLRRVVRSLPVEWMAVTTMSLVIAGLGIGSIFGLDRWSIDSV